MLVYVLPSARLAMPSVSVRVLPSVSNVSREAWNCLYAPTAEDWDFFRSCEIAPAAGFSTSVLAAFAGEHLVGAAPLFQVTFRVDMALGPRLGPLASWLGKHAPRLMNPSIVAIGSPQSDECPIGISPAANPNDRVEIFAALMEGLAVHASALGCSITALKDVRDADTLWAHASLRRAGFSRMASLPLAILELPYRDETEYLATFSPRFRSELRRKMRQASAVTVELRNSIDDIQEEIADLFQETRTNRRADYGSFDDVGPGFFPEVMRNLKGRAQVMLCRHAGELVSFNMFLVEPNRVLAKFIGMRYPEARELNLYYYNWVMMVRYCIEHGIPLLQTGQTTYEIKTHLGSKLKKSWIYFRHRGTITNQIFHAVAPFAALDRTDPDLRYLGTQAPYVSTNYVAPSQSSS
jgi:predicted N-acyltransferase